MLWEKTNYTSSISYLTNVFITEYDIEKANINVLYTKGMIPKDIYEWLYSAEKMVREKYIGMLQRDNLEYTRMLKEGIIEAKKLLFEANQINDNEVLSIRNDAVYVINRTLEHTRFGLINFKKKETYTSFYQIKDKEFYYYYNRINKIEYIEVKGINNSVLKLHENGFLQILKDVFYTVQLDGPKEGLEIIKDVYNKYIRLELPVECYREFNVDSQYHFRSVTKLSTGFTIQQVTDDMKPLLDITNNLSILIELNKIVVNMLFNS